MNSTSDGLELEEERTVLRAFQKENSDKCVGVIYGPRSQEDAYYIEKVPRKNLGISHLLDSLDRLGFAAKEIDPTANGFLEAVQATDFCFLNMHGEYGEDGRLQGFLDYLGKPYIGSGVQASAIGLNKVVCKYLMSGLGLLTPKFIDLGQNDAPKQESIPAFPLIAKQIGGGSSIGAKILHEQKDLEAFLDSGSASSPW